jgi:hypothetical protein
MIRRNAVISDLYQDIEIHDGLGEDVIRAVLEGVDRALQKKGMEGIHEVLVGNVASTQESLSVEDVNKFLLHRKGKVRIGALRNGVVLDISVQDALYMIKEA